MARLFDIVRELSGQSASISIPRPYIKFCGNYNYAVVLSQLVFWSSTKPDGEWFYKANEELAAELELSVDQVRHAVRQLKQRLGDVIRSRVKKANGVPTTHYQIDGDKLVELLFPETEQDSQIDMGNLPERDNQSEDKHNSQMEMGILPDGNGSITTSNRETSHIHGNGNITESINRSLPYTNKQISYVPSQLETGKPAESVLFKIPLNRKGTYHDVTESDLAEWRETYPAVDVPQQIRQMIAWCNAKPQKRKTAAGAEAFITGWLCREQDRGYVAMSGAPVRPPKTDRDKLRDQIRQLEMDINNENQSLIRARQWGATPMAIEASESRLTRMQQEHAGLKSQLRGMNG